MGAFRELIERIQECDIEQAHRIQGFLEALGQDPAFLRWLSHMLTPLELFNEEINAFQGESEGLAIDLDTLDQMFPDSRRVNFAAALVYYLLHQANPNEDNSVPLDIYPFLRHLKKTFRLSIPI